MTGYKWTIPGLTVAIFAFCWIPSSDGQATTAKTDLFSLGKGEFTVNIPGPGSGVDLPSLGKGEFTVNVPGGGIGLTLITAAGSLALAALAIGVGSALAPRRPSVRRPNGILGLFRGKREVDEEEDSVAAEIRLLNQAYQIMVATDGSDCYRRLVCELATEEGSGNKFEPILNIVRTGEELEQRLPAKQQSFYYQLAFARKAGEQLNRVGFCRTTFSCDFNGTELDESTL